MRAEPNAPRERLIDEALDLQRQIYTALQAGAFPQWLQLDLTMAQLKALFSLAGSGPTTIGQLADTLDIGRPAASILTERLVQLGLVERTEDRLDRRRTFARLTPRGEELVLRLRQGGRERLRAWLERLADEELDALIRASRAVVAAAGEEREARAATAD